MPGAAGDDRDDHEDEGPEDFSAPPHPLDRLWRHPSELPAVSAARTPSRRPRTRTTVFIAVAAAGVGAVATVAVLAAFGMLESQVKEVPQLERVQVSDAAVARLAANIAPSIVTISVVAPDGVRRGSGVCVRHDGDILTSDHLVRNAISLSVTTNDGMTHAASVRGHDADTDLALVHIDGTLQAAPVSEDVVHPGDTVLVVGTADEGGTTPWIGDGIVASVSESVSQLGGPSMDGLIATSASPGRDGVGGALLDRSGNVAGIVLSPISGDSTTYAVPMPLAAQVADQLSIRGVATHGWLGVQGSDTNLGPMVRTMTPLGPAALAGFHAGDVIVSVSGLKVDTVGDVAAAVRWYRPGAAVIVKVRRNDQLVNLTVHLGSTRPTPNASPGV
jgi:S1-C subfamily serine protease